MLGKIKDGMKQHWPAIPTILSAGAIATGVAFGATKQFMISVGTSNLPMVLALCGASLSIIAACLYTGIDYIILENDTKERKDNVLMIAIVAALVVGCGYAAVHFGFAQILPSTLKVAESLWAQAGIGFAIGFVPTFIVSSILGKDEYARNWHKILAGTLAAGVCVAASSALGPALVATIGARAAARATEAMALEATISVGVALFSFLFIVSMVDAAGELDNACEKLECMKSHIA